MTQRTKLLIVSPLFPSPALPHNGIEESQLLAWLQRFGFAPRVVVPLPLWRSPLHGRVRRVPAIERSGAAVVVHPRYVGVSERLTARGHGKRLETWLYRRALCAALDAFHRSAGAGLLHVHSCVTAGYALLALRRDAPFVVTVHDSDLQTTAPHPRLRHRVAAVLRAADHVVYQSSKLRQMGETLVGAHPSSVIPWGVETYEGLLRREPEVFTVTSVARLVPTKGLDLLLKAFHKLLATIPDARMEIIGEGPQRPALERHIERLSLRGQVQLLGWLPNRLARQRVGASSAFVLPSYVEALGVAYLEAMSIGVPTVGVQGQGIADVIEHGRNGLLLPPRNVAAIHAVMLRLARDKTFAHSIGDAGRETFARGRYDWKGNAERHATLYRELLARWR